MRDTRAYICAATVFLTMPCMSGIVHTCAFMFAWSWGKVLMWQGLLASHIGKQPWQNAEEHLRHSFSVHNHGSGSMRIYNLVLSVFYPASFKVKRIEWWNYLSWLAWIAHKLKRRKRLLTTTVEFAITQVTSWLWFASVRKSLKE